MFVKIICYAKAEDRSRIVIPLTEEEKEEQRQQYKEKKNKRKYVKKDKRFWKEEDLDIFDEDQRLLGWDLDKFQERVDTMRKLVTTPHYCSHQYAWNGKSQKRYIDRSKPICPSNLH